MSSFRWGCATGTLKPSLTLYQTMLSCICNPILEQIPKPFTTSQTSDFPEILSLYIPLISFLANHTLLMTKTLISIPYSRLNCLKTIPFTVAHITLSDLYTPYQTKQFPPSEGLYKPFKFCNFDAVR